MKNGLAFLTEQGLFSWVAIRSSVQKPIVCLSCAPPTSFIPMLFSLAVTFPNVATLAQSNNANIRRDRSGSSYARIGSCRTHHNPVLRLLLDSARWYLRFFIALMAVLLTVPWKRSSMYGLSPYHWYLGYFASLAFFRREFAVFSTQLL